jgi:HSP20 family protein
VVETPSSVEVVVDLPGVALADIRVVFKRGALIVAGEKHPPAEACQDGTDFHLVERSFGRFARVVRFDHPVNGALATASLGSGVLRISVPRVAERRGREIVVPIEPRPS